MVHIIKKGQKQGKQNTEIKSQYMVISNEGDQGRSGEEGVDEEEVVLLALLLLLMLLLAKLSLREKKRESVRDDGIGSFDQ